MDHLVSTHNGIITMRNPATGRHRTIRIKTQKPDADFAAGERIAALLNGPNNDSDYQQFAFIKPGGRVIVWKRFRGENMAEGDGGLSQYERLAWMLQDPARYEAQGVEYEFATTCRRCNRTLTTPESIRDGIGPVCAAKE